MMEAVAGKGKAAASAGTAAAGAFLASSKVPKCPICLDMVQEAFLTKCGHTFCFCCIEAHLKNSATCPSCTKPLKREEIFPNFALNSVVESIATGPAEAPMAAIGQTDSLSESEVDDLLARLLHQKRMLLKDTRTLDLEICAEFLESLQKDKRLEKELIENQIRTIEADLKRTRSMPEIGGGPATKTSMVVEEAVAAVAAAGVTRDGRETVAAAGYATESPVSTLVSPPSSKRRRCDGPSAPGPEDLSLRSERWADDSIVAATAKLSEESCARSKVRDDQLRFRRQRMHNHYKDLEKAYLESYSHHGHKGDGVALNHFEKSLSRFTRFSKFRVFAQLNYAQVYHASSIVSSIEFDRDSEYFATAGVTKEIKVYEYKSVVEQPHIETHAPVMRMRCQSKISCLSWNPYHKQNIASSDYEGIVSLWDAYSGKRTVKFEGHKKRTWSVDFAPTSPSTIASGSDDHHVKIWDVHLEKAVTTIESKANVCCVKFNPENSHYIAFGSADHNIHYYDLRFVRESIFAFKGHAKAVSYVKFLSADELVSASTDSTLKLWSTSDKDCKRTFTGHTNEKNFVGLSICNDFIACGSENNAVYTYYKSLSSPVIVHRFTKGSEEDPSVEDTSNFVSSVCWKDNSQVLLAANSLGTISIMQLD